MSAQLLSRVWLCDPWTIACQAPLSMGFSRAEYWRGLSFFSPWIFLTQGLNTNLLHWQVDSLPLSHLGSPESAVSIYTSPPSPACLYAPTFIFYTKKSFSPVFRKWSDSCSVMSKCLWPHGLYSPWNSSGQNTGVGSLSLLRGIFPTQGWNPGLPHCRQILYQLSHKGSWYLETKGENNIWKSKKKLSLMKLFWN